MMQSLTDAKHLVLFDSRCGLCSNIVRFLRKKDHCSLFAFLPLEEAGLNAPLHGHEPDTIILVCNAGSKNETIHVRSEAVLEIFRLLGGLWRALVVFRIVPRSFRDAGYSWVSRHRKFWSGPEVGCAATDRGRAV